ncbi:riboflavin synthase domain-like protein [Stipitochalara longipes BDJ]|nr:riboflavin synthase domain-like protein [Stipitochalara longipes BDJ]
MTDAPRGQRHDRNALILYGSETGNSQDAAEALGRIAERLHFVTRVSEMDVVEINILLKYTVVVFVIATTGQGEFPKNARKFWKSLLRKRLPPGCLDHVSFTTFGLGDSSYPKYNFSARKLHKRLEQLGAKEIYPRGEGDEQHPEGIDGTFLSWSVDLGKHLLSSYPLPEGVTPIPPEVPLPPKITLEVLESSAATSPRTIKKPFSKLSLEQQTEIAPQPGSFSLKGLEQQVEIAVSKMRYEPPVEPDSPTPCEQVKEHLPSLELPRAPGDHELPPPDQLPFPDPTEVQLISNRRLTPESHWQDVRELTFIMDANFDYDPGETVTIYPKNFPEDVQALIDLQGWNGIADKPLRLKPEPPNFYLDEYLVSMAPGLYPLEHTTLRDLLIHNLDITAIPKRYFFELLALHTDDPMHKERLLEFTNPAFTDEFYDYTTRPRRSILEVLQDFPSVRIPWKLATNFFPIIRGRAYSIATGGSQARYMEDRRFIKFQIIVALVKYRTVLKKIRQGLCSRYIASLPEGTDMHVKFTPHDKFYELAKNKPHRPLILIAPGTGLAPCRSLIWDREELLLECKRRVGKSYLFYGGRNKEADFFYSNEWRDYRALQVEVFPAFSRDQKEKIYVQDIIRQNGKMVEQLIRKENAIIYVCGSSGKMPTAVKDALIDACFQYQPEPKCAKEKIAAGFETFVKDGRYIQETW